ncbi:FitA-like ribbon-helix-helix domain-containing protein [Methyloceanibacter sp.]|uniref:FitA-like ribbon-helix-helix domain-containing protein n=1 Tax=Methyloceanibacter sp. TaxID=1965321 RepID=UPI003D6CDF27
MSQITIRRLDPAIIEGLKKRAADAGHSMEEEARTILVEAIADKQLERQRAWLKEMEKVRRKMFGDKVFPDSSEEFRRMRDERTRYLKEWALPPSRRKR